MNVKLLTAVADQLDGAVGQLRAAADDANAVGKIDWSNFRAFLALMIETLVPIILPLIVAQLDPDVNPTTDKKDE